MTAENNSNRERELVLAPNQYALIQDETKGQITVYVGPHKASLSVTDKPVQFASASSRFERCTLEQAIREFPLVVEGSYVVLQNPADDDKQPHPAVGSASSSVKLKWGRKVNLPGPTTFPLWPGQVATVLDGHRLRSNQYLLVRVYDEQSARDNLAKTVLKRAAPPTPEEKGEAVALNVRPEEIVIGKLFVIKGTDASFFIPPTGMEVVPDEKGSYVREAVTLERLEYCILLDENGCKKFVRGPNVVFPEPTQTFVTRAGDGGLEREFRAIELNNDMGIFVKVIADYEDETGKHAVGEELFITGKQQKIYYPREEHALIKYGDRERHYAVVIPAGEGRYVLNKDTGNVETIKGPKMLLPDPRSQAVVRRMLDDSQVQLWFPGNAEARDHNAKLREIVRSSGEQTMERALSEDKLARVAPAHRAASATVADDFNRGRNYTPPRTLTLDSKYEGAVQVNVWNGYAVMVVNKSGERSRVVTGPQTVLLGYDEFLQPLELSTGKPKTTDKLLRTVFLMAQHNHVTDIVEAFTKDMVKVSVKLSYRVNFEGDPQKWFNVENYVKYLCDHMRSLLANAVKKVGIEEFTAGSIDLVRDTVLGGKAAEGGPRAGKSFEENGMRVYEVEVLQTTIGDADIAGMLQNAQHDTVKQALSLAAKERGLATAKRLAEVERQTLALESDVQTQRAEITKDQIARDLEIAVQRLEAEAAKVARDRAVKVSQQETLDEIADAELARAKAAREQELALLKSQLDQKLAELAAETEAAKGRAGAVSPQLIAALQAFGDKFIAVEAAKAMSPLAILGGESVADVLGKLLANTSLAGVLKNGKGHQGNGDSAAAG